MLRLLNAKSLSEHIDYILNACLRVVEITLDLENQLS